jgi:hypothetical protein
VKGTVVEMGGGEMTRITWQAQTGALHTGLPSVDQ